TPVGLAVRLEPASLVEVEQHTADLVRRQLLGQRARPEPVHAGRNVGGLAEPPGPAVSAFAVIRLPDQFLTGVFVRRHQAVFGQDPEQRGTAGEIAVTPTSHRACRSTVDRERRTRFRLAPVTEDAGADGDYGALIARQRLASSVDQAPAERTRAEIYAQCPHCS